MMQAEREIRGYLLGALSIERVQEVEERILQDDNFHQEVEIAEEELLDDYVRDNLPAQERRLFEEHFLASPLRQKRLKFARAFQERLDSSAFPAPTIKPRLATNVYRYALVASLLLAAFLGNVSYRASRTIQEERTNSAALKKELEEARRQQVLLAPNSILQVALAPKGSRGGAQLRLNIAEGVHAVRFVLAVPSNLQGKAQVDLLNDAGRTILSQRGNLLEQGRSQTLLSAIIESKYLQPGDYFLQVTHLQASALAEYAFQVSSNDSETAK